MFCDLLQQPGVSNLSPKDRINNLGDAHISVIVIRVDLRQLDPELRSSGVPHQVDLAMLEALFEELGQFVAVIHKLLEGHRALVKAG